MVVKFARISSLIVLMSFTFYYCKTLTTTDSKTITKGGEGYVKPDIPWMKEFKTSPFVSPEQSLSHFQVDDQFEVKLVAAEPFVQTPVNLLFDDRGRLWVTEMVGYMPDVLGTGEDEPNGKIVILEDTDGDGLMDKRTVFLDSLRLPRSICFVENGLLVAEPPYLWYYTIQNDRPAEKMLVDSTYAVGGNVEHQPNGLLRGIDNWIYNAKSRKRYKKVGQEWLIEPTHFRGQWGISQDNRGRLYYNHNSANVLGDYFLPGFGHWNPNLKNVAGYNARIVASNRVYPARPTPGINRGYREGMLDDSLRLINFTAACGPLVYRGDLFSDEFQNNVFVPEPSANLIKRNIISDDGYLTKGRQAYDNREFLASTDERFRPVELRNSPEGALYIVDMYRGIIQHKTYLTPYLRSEIEERSLTNPLTGGRIYKVVPKGSARSEIKLSNKSLEEWVGLLKHPNGWIRDFAQQKIVDSKDLSAVPLIRKLLSETQDGTALTHAYWTLEGLGVLTAEDVIKLYEKPTYRMKELAFGLTPSILQIDNHLKFLEIWNRYLDKNDTITFPYIAYCAQYLTPFDVEASWTLWQKLAQKQPDNPYVAAAIVSNLHHRESEFLSQVENQLDTGSVIVKQLKTAMETAEREKEAYKQIALAKKYPAGAEIYNTLCQTCHGMDGNGVKSLAPPLNQSEWVTGNKKVLISIVLYGLTGPVKVNNYVYQAPEISADMPGIGFDASITNEQIAELLSYIRASWQNDAGVVTTQEVDAIRKRYAGREKAFTVEELDAL